MVVKIVVGVGAVRITTYFNSCVKIKKNLQARKCLQVEMILMFEMAHIGHYHGQLLLYTVSD